MSNTSINVEFLVKLELASSLDVDSILPPLYKLLDGRKEVASRLMRKDIGEDEYNETLNVYNYINYQIKLLLRV